MKQKNFSASDSVKIVTACGFQPDLIYFGTGGTVAYTTSAGDTVTTTVGDGQWWPADDIVLVKVTGSAGIADMVGYQE
jgi:hypothetical protein